MASWYSVGIAGLMFLLYQWFREDPLKELSAGKPMLPSVLVSICVLDVIANKVQLPQPLLYTACWIYKFIFEIIVSIFVLYLTMNIVWNSLETLIVLTMRIILCGYRLLSEETYKRYEKYWIGGITLPLSLIIWVILSRPIFCMRVHLIRNIDNAMKYLERTFQTKKAPQKRPIAALR
ncbi:uncharacterized protein LOC111076959 [Drosophila obscura]|uniref:uncharacterized protein LOC111076959 n=1 Tax=Drosophila obscura TaxID=7282 RepID=UPI001BB0EA21|nr:uncharacterized protein LOC111076959 [Drosophila obscura]